MSQSDTSQDYLTHYFDIARYQLLFALLIGVFLALFLLVFQPFGVNNFDPTFHISLEFALAVGAFGWWSRHGGRERIPAAATGLRRLTRRRLVAWLVWTLC